MSSPIAVLVAPHDGPPYQELLYGDVEKCGVRVFYEDGPTFSQTLNIALAPVVLAWRRLNGCRILHLHWVFQFTLPWARRARWARLVMEWWFYVYLASARALGYKVIWTAHDLLPHTPVFEDDERARRHLIRKASAVIALSKSTAATLGQLGAPDVRVIPFGTYAAPYSVTMTRAEARASFGFDDQDVVVSLVGRLEPYKGADVLLRALRLLPETSRIKVLVAGVCPNNDYLKELTILVNAYKDRVTAEFSWIPDNALARYYQASDVAVFAFREITNSGSVLLAQSFGLPVVIPRLENLDDIPDGSALRIASGVEALGAALNEIEQLPRSALVAMGEAGFAWANRITWPEAAAATIETYRRALDAHT